MSLLTARQEDRLFFNFCPKRHQEFSSKFGPLTQGFPCWGMGGVPPVAERSIPPLNKNFEVITQYKLHL